MEASRGILEGRAGTCPPVSIPGPRDCFSLMSSPWMKFGSQYVKELSFCTGIAYIFYMAARTQRISGEEGSPAPRLRRRSRPGTFLALFLLAVLAVSVFQVASKFPDLSDP